MIYLTFWTWILPLSGFSFCVAPFFFCSQIRRSNTCVRGLWAGVPDLSLFRWTNSCNQWFWAWCRIIARFWGFRTLQWHWWFRFGLSSASSSRWLFVNNTAADFFITHSKHFFLRFSIFVSFASNVACNSFTCFFNDLFSLRNQL